MCIRDRYQRRVHGDPSKKKKDQMALYASVAAPALGYSTLGYGGAYPYAGLGYGWGGLGYGWGGLGYAGLGYGGLGYAGLGYGGYGYGGLGYGGLGYAGLGYGGLYGGWGHGYGWW
eukprot:TRINITY_DN8942_c0_g1_i1.p3 TRINITY_DN8942_c0_g1~~TRINITY_DN8942_c0_g1_i1.p3  ORF type:complete len:116 (+),score=29.06 TRINITY_DN8942_c0_g1_i1:66-413(+)